MQQEGLPDIAIRTFEYYYAQLLEGATGCILERDITPVESLPDLETLSPDLANTGRAALPHIVIVKVNGGLGTSMGLNMPKSLITVKEGLTFLDIIARQAILADIPLLLMNSFATREATLEALKRYPDLQGKIPRDFVQHKVPKVARDTLDPVSWSENPELEWCPPGHGDIYTSLVTSGMLDRLLESGYRYAFISNADNLGAVIEPEILGYLVENDIPFLMEVADRTEADKKGGHLARLSGKLILRETAQCTPRDLAAFQDVSRHRYFNCNSLWVNLVTLGELMKKRNNILGLPLIRNKKTVDPRDPHSTPVYHLETAMGAAISAFDGAGALRVPRSRFSPVKTTGDLFAVYSDAYELTEDFRVRLSPARAHPLPPVIDLDPHYYRHFDQLQERFPQGPPSLIECEHLSIIGDVRFGKDIRLKGSVFIVNESDDQEEIEDGWALSGELRF